jgi:hypothetical protein
MWKYLLRILSNERFPVVALVLGAIFWIAPSVRFPAGVIGLNMPDHRLFYGLGTFFLITSIAGFFLDIRKSSLTRGSLDPPAEGQTTIEITNPYRGAPLKNGDRTKDGDHLYPVRGRARNIPKEHEIWLLTQVRNSGDLYPQGDRPVVFEDGDGGWVGWVYARKADEGDHLQIWAVVAPPTSIMLFQYYECYGKDTGFAPIVKMPPECIVRESVWTIIPKT